MIRKVLAVSLTLLMTLTLCFGCTKEEATSSSDITAIENTNEDNNTAEDNIASDVVELTPVILNEVAHSIFYAPMYVAIENGYFEEEGIALELVTGFGADNTMTALLSNEAQIGFMGPESTIYTYQEGASDYFINFAQLTQRAGNFLVAREEINDFAWTDLIGTDVLAGRAGGMPQMVFEYILKENGINPETDLSMNQSIDFGATAAAFVGGQGEYTVEFEPSATALELEGEGYVVASLGVDSGYVPYTAFCAQESYINENPEIIQGFTNAIQKGLNFCMAATSEEIATIIAPQFSDTEMENLITIIERYYEQDTWPETLVFGQDGFELLQDVLDSAGVLNERVNYDLIVNTTFAENASNLQ
ncbi:MAG: ABC transporter substrate-binding protein [Eubacteriales bacterium]